MKTYSRLTQEEPPLDHRPLGHITNFKKPFCPEYIIWLFFAGSSTLMDKKQCLTLCWLHKWGSLLHLAYARGASTCLWRSPNGGSTCFIHISSFYCSQPYEWAILNGYAKSRIRCCATIFCENFHIFQYFLQTFSQSIATPSIICTVRHTSFCFPCSKPYNITFSKYNNTRTLRKLVTLSFVHIHCKMCPWWLRDDLFLLCRDSGPDCGYSKS